MASIHTKDGHTCARHPQTWDLRHGCEACLAEMADASVARMDAKAAELYAVYREVVGGLLGAADTYEELSGRLRDAWRAVAMAVMMPGSDE